jgi:hypothetical protein
MSFDRKIKRQTHICRITEASTFYGVLWAALEWLVTIAHVFEEVDLAGIEE